MPNSMRANATVFFAFVGVLFFTPVAHVQAENVEKPQQEQAHREDVHNGDTHDEASGEKYI